MGSKSKSGHSPASGGRGGQYRVGMQARGPIRQPKLRDVGKALGGRERAVIVRPELPIAAVLLLLAGPEGDYRVIFTKRTSKVEHHKGEISFPGGVREPVDKTLEQTALRETHEEVGVKPTDVKVLGAFDDIVTRSNIHVTPFVGWMAYPYEFKPFADEVAEILPVPLPHLLLPENIIDETREVDGKKFKMRSYKYGDHIIFGATAMMVRRFLDIVYPGLAEPWQMSPRANGVPQSGPPPL